MPDQTPAQRAAAELALFADDDPGRLPTEFLEPITDVSGYEEPEEYRGAIGRTMFDTPGAQDGQVTVPLTNSPVHILGQEDKRAALHADGDLRLGVLMGDPEVAIGLPSDKKSVLPRHLAVLGTTGGGKSTTIGRLISQAQAAGIAVVLL